MVRVRSLIDRLEIALSFTENKEEQDEVYALFYHISKRTLNTTPGEFYANLRQVQLEVGQHQGIPSGEDVRKGKILAETVDSLSSQPPIHTKKKRGYGPRYERARINEFEIIRSVIQNNPEIYG